MNSRALFCFSPVSSPVQRAFPRIPHVARATVSANPARGAKGKPFAPPIERAPKRQSVASWLMPRLPAYVPALNRHMQSSCRPPLRPSGESEECAESAPVAVFTDFTPVFAFFASPLALPRVLTKKADSENSPFRHSLPFIEAPRCPGRDTSSCHPNRASRWRGRPRQSGRSPCGARPRPLWTQAPHRSDTARRQAASPSA